MPRSAAIATVLLFAALLVDTLADEPSRRLGEALSSDDDCRVGGSDSGPACALSALQMRGARAPLAVGGATALSDVDPDTAEAVYINDLKPGWNDTAADPDADLDGDAAMEPMAMGGGGGCQYHDSTRRCYLYRVCQDRPLCVIAGYMVVPGRPVSGMESINGGNAGSFDYLMSAARGQCGSPSCVLITNPVHHRTQDQLHIHYRHYNGGGAALKSRLEDSLCGTDGWKNFAECGSGKARLFDGFPGVFSAVAAAEGGGSLANVGITVWFTTACSGGLKTMILITHHCSIEHSISAR